MDGDARPTLGPRSTWPALLVVLGGLCLGGCGWRGCTPAPRSPAELREAIRHARDECRAAQGAKDAPAAEKAASRAEDAIERLRAAAAGPDEALAREAKGVVSEADAEAREARYLADLADDERRLAQALGSVKARLYRAARPVALAAVFESLALAAQQAEQRGTSGLPQSVRDAAGCAAVLSMRPPRPDGEPDWAAIAADMNAAATVPPDATGYLLAAGFLVLGRTDLALVEISLVDPEHPPSFPSMSAAEARPLAFVERGIVYQTNELRRLAGRDFTAAVTVHGGAGEAADIPPFLRARTHAILALFYMADGDDAAADRELVEVLRADPSGPVAAFLTGERLARDGNYEKAAKSMEAALAASGNVDPWLARRIAERARELRDKRGAAEPLLYDNRFLVEIGLHYMGEAAKASEPARRLQRSLDAARDLCTRLLAGLPGFGRAGAVAPVPEASATS